MSVLVDNLNKLKSILSTENPEMAAVVDVAAGLLNTYGQLEEPLAKWRDTLEAIASGQVENPVQLAEEALIIMENKEKELGIAQGR